MSDQNLVDKINLKTKKMAPRVWPDQIAGTVGKWKDIKIKNY